MGMNDNFDLMQQELSEAFPEVDCGQEPLGGRVLVQLRRPVTESKGGIVLIQDTQDTVKWNIQVARVVKLGPLAYRNRETREVWPEGEWVKPGDYIRVPRWNGDRIEVAIEGSKVPVTFVVFNDHEIIAKITGNPLDVPAYIK